MWGCECLALPVRGFLGVLYGVNKGAIWAILETFGSAIIAGFG
jgi:hypothetical protein